MDKIYHKVYDDISRVMAVYKGIMDAAPTKTREENNVYHAVESLYEQFENALNSLKYLGSPAKEGRLREESCGKFVVVYDDGTVSDPLRCGSTLEIPNPEEDPKYNQRWFFGKVEGCMTDQGNKYNFSEYLDDFTLIDQLGYCSTLEIKDLEGCMTNQGNHYCLYGGAKPALCEGMRVRKRDISHY